MQRLIKVHPSRPWEKKKQGPKSSRKELEKVKHWRTVATERTDEAGLGGLVMGA